MMNIRRSHVRRIPAAAAAVILLFAGGCTLRPAIAQFSLNPIPPLASPDDAPMNIILVIGDGMGTEQVRAGGMWANGAAGTLSFENTGDFPVSVSMGTTNVYGRATDSAASATAMATGVKVENRVLSLDIPGTKWTMPTLAEMAGDAGLAIGLVTTDSVYSATPAAFAVHHDDRNDYGVIIGKMLGLQQESSPWPEVLFGGGKDLSGGTSPGPTAAETAAFSHILQTDIDLSNHDPADFPVFGRFGDDIMPYVSDGRGNLPSLDAMVEAALDILDVDTDGFFLIVENELTDEACHLNDMAKLVEEVDALDQAVTAILQWDDARTLAGDDSETLIIVTADHETGGLAVAAGTGAGVIPAGDWGTTGHTKQNVMLYARGPDSGTFALVKENVDIHRIISRYFE